MSRAGRYYVTDDAILAIIVKADGWHIAEHVARQPGLGQGQKLRAMLLPTLAAAADSSQVTVFATAATEDLAGRYIQELPGLVVAGRGRLRGVRLRRDPRPIR